jgi:hypothetical protein
MNNNISFYKEINPSLHICDSNFLNQEIYDFDNSILDFISSQSIKEGYFQLDPIDWKLPIYDMANAIIRLKEQKILTAYAFVYDEYWLMFYKLHKILLRLLGNYKRIPGFWAWHIDPSKEESGWGTPHRDKGCLSLFEDGTPKTYSIWLPLTDTTPLNGCLYIVPADRDPYYNKPNEGILDFKYSDIRALPATAGSILGWTDATLHWGSHSSKLATTPRISIAMEFQKSDVEPFSYGLTDYNYFYNFDERLKVIWQQISQYRYWLNLGRPKP